MIFLDIFVFLEHFSNFLRGFAFVLFEKLVKIGVFLDQVWVVLECIHDNMEQSDSATGVFGVLFHVK
jgi:hypothetical protein